MRTCSKLVGQVFLIIIAAVLGAHTASAVSLSGTFTAERACPAYVSKNNKTNPDGAGIAAGVSYTALEANKSDRPDWYRIRLASANPAERWVSVDCGTFKPKGNGPGDEPVEPERPGNQCNVTGQADSYVLALIWQPAFCETKPDKPECGISDPSVYQARNFTLHGLWPNKEACGTGYGFCGSVKRQENDFCDYPAVALDASTRKGLAQVMPSVVAGFCLERHEWHKHGTCQKEWQDDQYFDMAVDLTRQFNESGMAHFMNRRIGREIRTEDFLSRLAAVLGAGSRERVKLGCKNGMLVEVQISLPARMERGEDLDALMARAAPKSGSTCGAAFHVDPIGQAVR